MITRMTGVVNRLLDDEVRLQVGPYEYQILIPDAIRWRVQQQVGKEISFHILEYLEGNSGGNRFVPRRLGFLSEIDVEFFELFCTVDKIGAKKALKAMARPVRDIAAAIARQDSKWLSTLPGIGPTTADAIVTTLKRKVAPFAAGPAEPTPTASETTEADPASKPKEKGKKKPAEPAPMSEALAQEIENLKIVEEVYQAMMALGHTPAEARTRVDSLLSSGKKFQNVEEALQIAYSRN